MIVEAFTAIELLGDLPVIIESICTFHDKLLVGTRKGTLLFYSIEPQSDKINLIKTLKFFSKKPIYQLGAMTKFDLQLVCLTDSIISIHSVKNSDITIKANLSKTRGATSFVIHQSTASDEQASAQLAVAVKRKIVLFRWLKQGLPEELKEISLYDVPKSMVFCGSRYSHSMVVGMKGKYCHIDLRSNAVNEVLATSGKQMESTMLWIDSDRVAICKDDWSILVGDDGRPCKNDDYRSIKWSDNPIGMLYWNPYIIAVINKGLEIRTIQYNDAIQVLEMPRVRFVAQDKSLFVASTSHLWCINPKDLVFQVERLIDVKLFDLAEKINKMTIESSNDANYAARLRKINTQYAYHEFLNKKFASAMDRFQKTDVSVINVIGLFPDMLPKRHQEKQEYPECVKESNIFLNAKDQEAGIEALITYLVSQRYYLNKNEKKLKDAKLTKTIIDTTLLKCYLQNRPSMVASLLRLKDNECHIPECEKFLKRHKRVSDIILLYKSKDLHEKALNTLRTFGSSPNSTQELSGPDHTIKYLMELGPDHFELIKTYSKWVIERHPDKCLDIFTGDEAVRVLPHIEVYEHIKSLNPDIAFKYMEQIIDIWGIDSPEVEESLIQLLLEKVIHEWTVNGGNSSTLSSDLSSGKIGELRSRLLHYLERLKKYDADKILKMITYDMPLYEELAILFGRQVQESKALFFYCHVIRDQNKAEKFAEKYEEKYRLQEKEQPDKRTKTYKKDIFLQLLDMYINPPPKNKINLDNFKIAEAEPNLAAARNVLTRQYKYIDIIKALQMLPSNTKLSEVEDFMCQIIKDKTKQRRKNQIFKSLHQADHLQVKSRKIFYQRDKLIIAGDDVCFMCNKRVGDCAFAYYPDHRIVHYGCMNK